MPTDDRAVLPVLAALTKSKPTRWTPPRRCDRDRSRKYLRGNQPVSRVRVASTVEVMIQTQILPLLGVLARVGRVAVLGPFRALGHGHVADVAVALVAGLRVIRRRERVQRALAARVREVWSVVDPISTSSSADSSSWDAGLSSIIIRDVLGVLGRVAEGELDLGRVDRAAEDRR